MACLFLTPPVWAQTQAPAKTPAPTKPAVNTDSIVTNIQSQLKLTQAQAQEITPIIAEENQKLSKILTADQMNQWLNMLNQFHQKHKKAKHTAASTSSGSKI